MSNTNHRVGRAGVDWVSATLSARGMVLFTVPGRGNAADLIVLDPESGGLASLKVRTSNGRPKFWPCRAPPEGWSRPSHRYVFLRLDEGGDGYEAFLVDAAEVGADVAANLADLASRGSQPFEEYRLPKDPGRVARLKARWTAWRP